MSHYAKTVRNAVTMMSDIVQQAQSQQQQHQQQQQQQQHQHHQHHHHDSMDDDDDDDDDHHDEIVNDDDRLPGETETEIKRRKRKERLEQNRISARESRKRKKTMIEELQRTVITLSRENKDLNERNEQLRRNLMEIGTKVGFFVVFTRGQYHGTPVYQYFVLAFYLSTNRLQSDA